MMLFHHSVWNVIIRCVISNVCFWCAHYWRSSERIRMMCVCTYPQWTSQKSRPLWRNLIDETQAARKITRTKRITGRCLVARDATRRKWRKPARSTQRKLIQFGKAEVKQRLYQRIPTRQNCPGEAHNRPRGQKLHVMRVFSSRQQSSLERNKSTLRHVRNK